MKWSVMVLIVVGLIAATSVAVLVRSLQASYAKQRQSEEDSRKVTVVIATRNIAPMSIVSGDAIEERSVLATEAPADHMSSFMQVAGKVVVTPIAAGQVITKGCFPAPGRGVDLAAGLQPGTRAMTVSLADYAGMEGLLYPGAVVDVLASFRLESHSRSSGRAISTTLLRGVQVLAIEGQTIQSTAAEDKDEDARSGAASSRSRISQRLKVTVLVDSRQAEALQLAIEHGVVSFAMRNPLDAIEGDKDAMMLSEGRLAELASFLPSSVEPQSPSSVLAAALEKARGADQTETRKAPKPDPTIEPISGPPVVTPQPTWNVQIIRGVEVEIRSFTLGDQWTLQRVSDPQQLGNLVNLREENDNATIPTTNQAP